MKKSLVLLLLFFLSFTLAGCYTNVATITYTCPTSTLKVGDEMIMVFTTDVNFGDKNPHVSVRVDDDKIIEYDRKYVIIGVAPGSTTVHIDALNGSGHDSCEITVVAIDISNNDVFDELVDVITEPSTMDLSDDAYLTYELSNHDAEYEFYYMQLNIDNDTYIIEYAVKDATESVYETGPLSDASGSYEIQRFNQPSGFNEFWGFNLVGDNMELYILYYYDDGNLVVDVFDPVVFVPIQ